MEAEDAVEDGNQEPRSEAKSHRELCDEPGRPRPTLHKANTADSNTTLICEKTRGKSKGNEVEEAKKQWLQGEIESRATRSQRMKNEDQERTARNRKVHREVKEEMKRETE